MLKAHAISFGYRPDRLILDEVTIRIQPGEVVGLYGQSGSGKSTLANILAGYLKPDKGTVSVDGVAYPLKGRNPVQLIGQHPEKAVNPRWKMNRVLDESGKQSDRLLEELGISNEWMHRYPSQLSGGELQRFCLARALSPETKYLIADEMTTMLDAITQARIWNTVLRLVKERQLGILVISHELPLLDQTCTRILNFEELGEKK